MCVCNYIGGVFVIISLGILFISGHDYVCNYEYTSIYVCVYIFMHVGVKYSVYKCVYICKYIVRMCILAYVHMLD